MTVLYYAVKFPENLEQDGYLMRDDEASFYFRNKRHKSALQIALYKVNN